jgi:hypothetical protein
MANPTPEEIAEATGKLVDLAIDKVAPGATHVRIDRVDYNTDTRTITLTNFTAELPDGSTMQRSSVTVQL